MKNKNNNLIMITVISLLVLGAVLVSPINAHAQTYTLKTGAEFTPYTYPVQTTTGQSNSNVVKSGNNNNSLTANAIFASNGLMPSNLFQWFMLFLIILLIVLTTRTLLGKKTKEKPLKHA